MLTKYKFNDLSLALAIIATRKECAKLRSEE